MTGAVHDGEGRLLRSSLRVLEGDRVPVDPEMAPVEDRAGARRVSRAVYGGSLYMALGHLLFETAPRLWPLMDLERRREGPDGVRVVFHAAPDFRLGSFNKRPMFRGLLAAFGIRPDDILIATEPLAIDLLYYPEPLAIYHDYMHPLMAEVFDHLVAELGRGGGLRGALLGRQSRAKRVFLSRSRWPHDVRIANEGEIEGVFRERGFAVVHSQELAPPDLVRTLQAAEIVAASDGTHGHLVAFCRPGTRVLLIDTRPVPTQVAIEKVRGLRALHLPVYIDPEGIWDGDTRRVETGRLAAFVDVALQTSGSS